MGFLKRVKGGHYTKSGMYVSSAYKTVSIGLLRRVIRKYFYSL